MVGTRDRLLDVAEEVLATEGIEAVTVRRVAREAGVSHGAPLRHFPSLRALLSAVAARGFEQLSESVRRAAATADDPEGRLAAAAHGYVDFALQHPGAFLLMFRHDAVDFTDPALGAAGTRAFDDLLRLVTEAQHAGWLPAGDPRQSAGVLWATVHGLAHLWLGGAYAEVTGTPDIHQAIDLMTHFYDVKESR